MRRYVGPLLCVLLVACPSSSTNDVQSHPDPAAQGSQRQTSAGPDPSSLRADPDPGEIVYYTTHPDHEKVDKYCGAHDRSYVVKHVDVSSDDPDALRKALEALFRDEWEAGEEVQAVMVDEGRATLNLRTARGFGFASTTCGGVSFLGSVLRTIFQFESIDEAQITLGGSCKRFGDFMQSLKCMTFTRSDL